MQPAYLRLARPSSPCILLRPAPTTTFPTQHSLLRLLYDLLPLQARAFRDKYRSPLETPGTRLMPKDHQSAKEIASCLVDRKSTLRGRQPQNTKPFFPVFLSPYRLETESRCKSPGPA